MIEGTMDATVVIHNRRIRGSRFKSSDLVIREKFEFFRLEQRRDFRD